MQRRVFGRTALIRSCLGIFLLAVAMVSGSGAQRRRGYPTPPPPVVPDGPTSPEPKFSPHRLDTVMMDREAKEMAALAASVPGDIEQLKKGLLPRDAFDKLKRIEKLSKQLRGQMRP
jgi:hypothetical protein